MRGAGVCTSEKRVRQGSCWRTKKIVEAAISFPNVKQGLRQVEILVEGHQVIYWCEYGLVCLLDVQCLEFERGTSIVHFEFISSVRHLVKICRWAFLPWSLVLIIQPLIMVKKCID